MPLHGHTLMKKNTAKRFAYKCMLKPYKKIRHQQWCSLGSAGNKQTRSKLIVNMGFVYFKILSASLQQSIHIKLYNVGIRNVDKN
jgi:hypothetical protein